MRRNQYVCICKCSPEVILLFLYQLVNGINKLKTMEILDGALKKLLIPSKSGGADVGDVIFTILIVWY